jgi:hypothetical protein
MGITFHLFMINVWLKIRDRSPHYCPGMNKTILLNLNQWLNTFSDISKYKIYLYNENYNLPTDFYPNIEVVNRSITMADPDCKHLENIIRNDSNIAEAWRNAAYALACPYYYLKDNNLIVNLDCDDLILYGPISKILDKGIEALNDNNLFTLSYDWIFTNNHDDPLHLHHWTFGINISVRDQMKSAINDAIVAKPPWIASISDNTNLDYVMEKYLEKINPKYACFISKYAIRDTCGGWFCRYNPDKNCVENGISANDYNYFTVHSTEHNGFVRESQLYEKTFLITDI